jgi:RNA polymerase subunit RPABC4/transcription elongation factor Spt4
MDEMVCLDCDAVGIPADSERCPECGSLRLRAPEDQSVIGPDEEMGEHGPTPHYFAG